MKSQPFPMANPLHPIIPTAILWNALGGGRLLWRRSWIPILVFAAPIAAPWAAEAQSDLTAPGNLTATFATGEETLLRWDAPAQDAGSVAGYQILRRLPLQGESRPTVYVADTGSTEVDPEFPTGS